MGEGRSIMRKFHVALALFGVLAFSAFAAVSASAETTLLAEWLFNGAAVTALLPVETEGTIFLSTLVLGIKAVELECAGIFDGSVGPNGEDEITKVLNLAKEEISGTALVGLAVDCTVIVGSGTAKCLAGELLELWPLNLPWLTELFLMESGAFLDRIFAGPNGAPGYEAFCPVSGGENTCTGATSSTITSGATDVIGVFDATSEKANCTLGGEGAGDQEKGEGLTFETGGTLSVSSV
jgi:hypothetical protein